MPPHLRRVDLAAGAILVDWPAELDRRLHEDRGRHALSGDDRRARSASGSSGARWSAGLLSVGTEDPRAHTSDVHRTVDDRPYGGGPGMVLKPEPLLAAIRAAHARLPAGSPRVCLSAQGEPLRARRRRRSWPGLPGLLLVAGRYEGLDERVVELGIDRELSVGDYVLSGGELPALTVIDAVARLLPGALGDERSSVEDSFAQGLLDWPHYTRPEVFEGLSGAAGAIVGRSRRHPPLAPGAGRGAYLAAAARADRASSACARGAACVEMNFSPHARPARPRSRMSTMSKIIQDIEKAAHDPRGPGLQARRHRGRAGEGRRRRPRARPGLRGRRDRAAATAGSTPRSRCARFRTARAWSACSRPTAPRSATSRSSAAAACVARSSTICAICPARPRASKRRSDARDGR